MSDSIAQKNNAGLASNSKHNIVSAMKDTMNVKKQIKMNRRYKDNTQKQSLQFKHSIDSTKRGWNAH